MCTVWCTVCHVYNDYIMRKIKKILGVVGFENKQMTIPLHK